MYLYIIEGCFNCKRTIFSERLLNQMPCNIDIPDEYVDSIKDLDRKTKIERIHDILTKRNRLYNFKIIYDTEKALEDFERFFESYLESRPWSIQKTWFKRLYKNVSFSIIAPTGTGKSTFIALSSVYFASKHKKKVYIILPTKVLVKQMRDRIQDIIEKLNIDITILAYLGRKSKEIKQTIENGEFDILITSNQFLSKNFDILSKNIFDIIYVDDVDAFFRGSKNIEKVIELLGFSKEDIETAYKMIYAKRQGDLEKIEKLHRVLEKIKKKKHGVLILSSATGRIQGLRVLLYRELLDFTVGMSTTKIRNIVDIIKYPKKDIKEEVLDLVNILEDGILIFVTRDQGSEYAKELFEFLQEKGKKVGIAISEVKESSEYIEKFANGEINILIGVAHFYGLIVRGLDLPTRAKYAIFTGVPRIRINISNYKDNIGNILTLANILEDIIEDNQEKQKIRHKIKKISTSLRKLSQEALKVLVEAIKEDKQLDGWLEYLRKGIIDLTNIIQNYINNKEIIEKLRNHPDVSLEITENDIILSIPDIKTYIQASGRVSRLYAGGITKGLSIILVDNEKLLRGLEKRLRFYAD